MITRGKAGPTLLVGRDEEIALLEQAVDALRAGSGGFQFFVGEAGSGKTALLRLAQARAEGLTVLAAQGVADETTLAYAGLHRLLHPVAMRADALLAPADAKALTSALSLAGPGEADRTAVGAATLRFLRALAAEQPLLLAVDDLHCFDDESRGVLAFLIGRTGDAAIGLIGTSRVETVVLDLPDAPRYRLSGLDDAAADELLATVAAVPASVAVRTALVAATAGNPGALVELASLITTEQLRGVAMLPDPVPIGTATDWAFAGPVRALPEATRAVLLLAATDPTLDAAALGRAAAELGADLEALLPAEDAGLIALDLAGVSFTHPLTRAAAYHTASSRARREAHRIIARVCPDHATAHHAAIAREPSEELAAKLSTLADRERAERGHARAADRLQRAAELTPAGPERAHRFHTAATDAWLGGDTSRAIALLDEATTAGRLDPDSAATGAKVDLLRAQIMVRCGNAIDAYETLVAAASRAGAEHLQLATRALVAAGMAAWFAGDLRRFGKAADRAEALVGDRADELPPAVRLGLHYLTGLSAQFAGRLDEATGPLTSVVDAALKVDDPGALVLAAGCAIVGGDSALPHALAARGLAAARDSGARAIIPHAIEMLTVIDCWSGHYPISQSYAFEGLHLARQTGQANSECHLLAMIAMAAAISGQTEDCHRYARAAGTIARKHKVGLVIATAEWAIAMLDLVYGRWTPAFQRLGKLFRAAPGAGHPVVALYSAPYFIEAAVNAGQPAKAQRVLHAYEIWASTANRPGLQAIAARNRALTADGPEVDKHFREAIRQHHRTDRDFERAYTELLFARHLRRNRQRSDARDRLHSALEVFERLELSLWTKRARAELRAVGEREDVQPAELEADRTLAGSGLTAQQLQIARLIAEGATNREVAERMFVSPRTVDYHLRNIFQRLSINSRAELIRRFS